MNRTSELGYSGNITLFIRDEELDIDEITSMLGVVPSVSWKKGHPKSKKISGVPASSKLNYSYKQSVWKYVCNEELGCECFEEQIEYMYNFLKNKKSFLEKLESANVEIYLEAVIVKSKNDTAALILDSINQKRLGSLGLDLWISIF